MPSFRYRTYGLNVESEIACPDLLEWDGEPQVRIRYGQAPRDPESPPHGSGWRLISDAEFLLNLAGIGRFWVSRGEEIRIEPEKDASEEQLQAHAFGSIFGVLLHQRRQLPLHASAMATDGGAVLFAGPSGYGKSTLAGEMARRGYRILADDICAVTTHDGVSHVHPGRAGIHLTAESLERLEMVEACSARASHNPAKRLVPVEGAAQATPVRVRTVYVLTPADCAQIRLTRLSGSDKIVSLGQNVFRHYLLSDAKATACLFDELATLAQTADVVIVERPILPFLLTELADSIEEDLKQQR